jgi:hypothetical protein
MKTVIEKPLIPLTTMSTFEPSTIVAILKNSIQDQVDKKGFEKKWEAAVSTQ